MEDRETLKECMMKEVEIIQDIIKRMALNSFVIKGWAVTLGVGTLLLKRAEHQIWLGFLPVVVFWFLDAYFLWQERFGVACLFFDGNERRPEAVERNGESNGYCPVICPASGYVSCRG